MNEFRNSEDVCTYDNEKGPGSSVGDFRSGPRTAVSGGVPVGEADTQTSDLQASGRTVRQSPQPRTSPAGNQGGTQDSRVSGYKSAGASHNIPSTRKKETGGSGEAHSNTHSKVGDSLDPNTQVGSRTNADTRYSRQLVRFQTCYRPRDSSRRCSVSVFLLYFSVAANADGELEPATRFTGGSNSMQFRLQVPNQPRGHDFRRSDRRVLGKKGDGFVRSDSSDSLFAISSLAGRVSEGFSRRLGSLQCKADLGGRLV